MYKKDDLQEQKKDYKKAFNMYGVSAKSLLWNSRRSMEVHYKTLISDIEFENRQVFEIGCGLLGGALPYIGEKQRIAGYTGCDIVPEFIAESKKRYPKYNFILGDFREIIKPSDIVLCSGALNSNIPDAISYRENAIEMMFNNTKEILAFNMAGSFPQPKNSEINRVYYADSTDILKFCLNLSSKVIFKQHYKKNDFTVLIYK